MYYVMVFILGIVIGALVSTFILNTLMGKIITNLDITLNRLIKMLEK